MWPDWVHFYTWFTDGTFASKQAGLDFVMEGIVHDIVYFVTGIPNTRRKIESHEVENRSRQRVHELSWVDADEGLKRRSVMVRSVKHTRRFIRTTTDISEPALRIEPQDSQTC